MKKKTCLDVLLSKYTTRKLTNLGLPVRDRNNRYMVHHMAAVLLYRGNLSLEDFRDIDTMSVLLGKLAEIPDPALFKQYLTMFDQPARQVVLKYSIYGFSDAVQDYVLNELLTAKDIDNLASNAQSHMWTGDSYVRTLRMLYRNGLMGFGKTFNVWRRINPAQLSSAEITYYAPLVGRVDFSEFNSHDALNAYERRLAYYTKWEGFAETVPVAFLVRQKYEKSGNKSMVDLMAQFGLSGELLEATKLRRDIELQRLHDKDLADKKEKAEKEENEYNDIVKLFGAEGIVVAKPQNEKWNGADRYTVETIVEGVPHTMYIMKTGSWYNKKSYASQVKTEATDHFEMLQKYKDTIHAEFKRLQGIRECTHVMEGGGAQMQAFFSNTKGYLSIMYLGMKGAKPIHNWTAHWQQQAKGTKDPFGKDTFYNGKTAESDIERNK